MRTRFARALRLLLFATGCLLLVGAPSFDVVDDDQPAAAVPQPVAPRRPGALIPLYVSFASLNALDVDSTYRVLGNGGIEANPVARGMVNTPAALIAFKAATTSGAIFASERLRRRSPKAAIVLMAAFNSAMAAIVAHNYSVAGRGRPVQ